MEPVTPSSDAVMATSARHDLVIPKAPPTDTRVVVRSFDVDGPEALAARFVAVGQRLQAAVPMRIPVAEPVVRHRLSSAFGWYRTGRARHFVATVDGVDLGRCSAMLDDNAKDAEGRPVGYVGQWECECDDRGEAAAHALLELAVAWLREQGAADVVGPIDFSTWHGYRFRDGEGDGRDPLLTEPVTDQRAIAQWEQFGFVRDESYFSAEISDPQEQADMTASLVQELVGLGWRVRQLRMRDWEDLMERAHAMSMEEFTRQPYFTPISLEEFQASYASVKKGVDPRYVFTAWSPEGEFAGYVFGVRERGAALRALQRGGLRGKLAAMRASWHGDTVMVKTICVSKPYRQFGIAILLQAALYKTAIDTGQPRICNMLMHENNRSRMLTEMAGGVEFRTYITLRLAG
ncbi:MAG: sortase and related acyltransferase [Thermoleophilia bacterium]|nr:sortase and related acyltransferase [Thermoleophilia bacterium]